MKFSTQDNRLQLLKALLCIILITVFCCSENEDFNEPINPDAESINEYIFGLNYDPEAMLNVQDTGGSATQRTLNGQTNSNNASQGIITGCVIKDYTLESNFDDVAILRPVAGVIYPGALLVGNQDMLDGSPNPLAIDRAPVILTVDLPGIGSNGVIEIDNPNNATVQVGIDEALDWWNNNAYQDGYVNASNSSYQAAMSYSSTQLSMDIGLNTAWATGSIASQMELETNSERRVASMVFKQVFYTVTMNTPESINPAGVFGPNVSLENIQTVINENNPAAYVSSVNYGRIIMLRMETTNMNTEINLEAVMQYTTGVNETDVDINSQFEEVLEESIINIITIGGNAEVSSSAVDAANMAEGPGALNYIITGENAVYSANNPGVPIAYTIRYLDDNSIARMGYTTDYTVEECGSNPYEHASIKVINDFEVRNMRVRLSYKYRDDTDSIVQFQSDWVTVTDEDQDFFNAPDGSWNVEIEIEYFTTFGGFWEPLVSETIGYISSQRCYRGYNPAGFENIAWDNSCN
ncbi:thiol-activated cytolysin family protein [Winogradskyella sp.]|uniref:thiol-activated cytolysin family protein n=1 Tax=Winogradskyella sp. TaxID=1883156 RepID=UPI002634C372|nr:thiol-activated cytolysin family protein [Winogradskyella sp.]